MKYNKQQFLKDVRDEIDAIKKHATKEEIGNLDFNKLYPDRENSCVYGLMTGNCHSRRAAVLITKCCQRYFKRDDTQDMPVSKGFKAIKGLINGAKVNGFVSERIQEYDITHFSSLETYILLPEAKNKNVIEYLKGESGRLVL
jgi:hypothetical protein